MDDEEQKHAVEEERRANFDKAAADRDAAMAKRFGVLQHHTKEEAFKPLPPNGNVNLQQHAQYIADKIRQIEWAKLKEEEIQQIKEAMEHDREGAWTWLRKTKTVT